MEGVVSDWVAVAEDVDVGLHELEEEDVDGEDNLGVEGTGMAEADEDEEAWEGNEEEGADDCDFVEAVGEELGESGPEGRVLGDKNVEGDEEVEDDACDETADVPGSKRTEEPLDVRRLDGGVDKRGEEGASEEEAMGGERVEGRGVRVRMHTDRKDRHG